MFAPRPGLSLEQRFGPLPLVIAAITVTLAVLAARSFGVLGVAAAGIAVLLLGASARWRGPFALAFPAALVALPAPQHAHAARWPAEGPVRIAAEVQGPVRRDVDTRRLFVWLATPGESAALLAVVNTRAVEAPDALLPGDRVSGLGFFRDPERRLATGRAPIVELELAALRIERGPPSPSRLACHARFRLDDALRAHLAPADARLVAQLVLGQRSDVDDGLVEAHRATGLAHLLAVSGAHATLLAFLLAQGYALLRGKEPFRARGYRRVATGLLIVYGAIVGFEAPVLRAIAAWLLLALAGAQGRRATIGATLALPALITAFAAPQEVLGIGYCLSYAAVIGLAVAHEPGRVTGLAARLVAVCRASLFALLMTAPLTLCWFGQCAPWTLLGTPLLAPLVALMLGLGLATALGELVLPALAPLLAAPLGLTAQLYATTVRALAELPGAPLRALHEPTAAGLLAALLGALALLVLRPSRAGCAAACVLVCLPHFLPLGARESPALRLVELGHGEAALVTLQDGRRVLFDCGAASDAVRAARAVREVLDGALHLEHAVLSHPDADHVAGFVPLLAQVSIGTAWLPELMRGSPIAQQLAGAGVALRFVPPGSEAVLETGVVAWAPPLPLDAPSNEQSLWLRIDHGGLRLVLPADAGSLAIGSALTQFDLAQTDVLVLPHHGRGLPPSIAALLDATRPSLALASCNDDPPLAALARSTGAQVLTTHRCGTLTVRLDGSRKVATAREEPLPPRREAQR